MRAITVGQTVRRYIFGVKAEPLRFEKAVIADRHIQKGNGAILTDYPVGSPDNQFATMFTFRIHSELSCRKEYAIGCRICVLENCREQDNLQLVLRHA